jgi:ABC-type sugar transport system substrate-binding protein
VDAAMKTSGRDWGLPTQAFTPGVKKVAIISAGQSTPAAAVIAAAELAAAKAIGWQPSQIFDAALSTDKAGAFIRQVTEQGYDAIVFGALDPSAMKGPLDAALAKGIAIACVSCVAGPYQGKIATVNPNFDTQGELTADYLIASNKGAGTFVGLQDDSFPQVKQRMVKMAATLAADCPGCKYEKVNFSSSDLANPGPPTWTAVLAQHPKGTITGVVAPYDAAIPIMYKTAQQQGRSEIQMNSYDLAGEWANILATGSGNFGADTASPLTVGGWGAVDQVARKLAGVPQWDSNNLPLALVTTSNVSQLSNGDFVPTDVDYKSTFMKLWGRS